MEKKQSIQERNLKIETGIPPLNTYVHIKAGIKNEGINCHCPAESSQTQYYCIPCKVSCCEKCKLDIHKEHLLLKKKNYPLSTSKINECFVPIEEFYKDSKCIKTLDSKKTTLIDLIENTYKKIKDLLDKWREDRLKEVNELFDEISKNSTQILSKEASVKNIISEYDEKNQKFFNLGEKNRDTTNSNFLMNYDLLGLCKKVSKIIKDGGIALENNLDSYTREEARKYPQIAKDIEKILFPAPKIEKEVKGQANEDKFLLIHKLKTNITKFNPSSFKEIENRIAKYNKLIDTFKRTVFNSLNKHGTYKEIEKEITTFDKTKKKGADNLFSGRKDKASKQQVFSNLVPETKITKREQVVLDNPILIKYFDNLISKLFETYFKAEDNEPRSSHADLKIKVTDEDETNTGKVIEGTNQILIYNKKTNKVERKTLALAKNPYGYNKFPIGCRSILIGDKFYITGGKDETQEYPTVLVYDRKTEKIKRIMDMKNSRCYHTLIFNELFETIIVFGGEENGTAEIFDPLTNRWHELPELIYPRANPLFFFDEPRGLFFIMFGIEGSFLEGRYNDTIEVLDLKEISKGWKKFNYYNKIGLNLKMYLNMIPLNTELILIYGGMESRYSKRAVCVLNIVKNEITNVDPNLMEELRREAKNNRRLTLIVASVSNTSMSVVKP